MREKKIFARIAGVDGARGIVIDKVRLDDEADRLIVRVRRRRNARPRCGKCGAKSPRYDRGNGPRRWRSRDAGPLQVWVEAPGERVQCATCGVVASWVPWARYGARFTRSFEDTVAWLTARTDKTTVKTLMGIDWCTVGRIVERVVEEARGRTDWLSGLRRIGIDEIAYRKRHKYLVVVLDHDTGRLVWAAEGRTKATVEAFFDALGVKRAAKLELVTADAANWIGNVVRKRAPQATLCLDPFHIVQWAQKALDKVRRKKWRELKDKGPKGLALDLQRMRFALWRGPADHSEKQKTRMASIKRHNKPLYRAYLLKEQLREVIRLKGEEGIALLSRWLSWACRSRLAPFVELSRRIRKHREAIEATLEHGIGNARVESLNTRIRLLFRMAFGLHSAGAAIALMRLKLGGVCPPLPGRR